MPIIKKMTQISGKREKKKKKYLESSVRTSEERTEEQTLMSDKKVHTSRSMANSYGSIFELG